jgi:hypothetical protein
MATIAEQLSERLHNEGRNWETETTVTWRGIGYMLDESSNFYRIVNGDRCYDMPETVRKAARACFMELWDGVVYKDAAKRDHPELAEQIDDIDIEMGQPFEALIAGKVTKRCQHGDHFRYTFADGSCIVEWGDGWGIGVSPECYCVRGLGQEGHASDCMLAHQSTP